MDYFCRQARTFPTPELRCALSPLAKQGFTLEGYISISQSGFLDTSLPFTHFTRQTSALHSLTASPPHSNYRYRSCGDLSVPRQPRIKKKQRCPSLQLIRHSTIHKLHLHITHPSRLPCHPVTPSHPLIARWPYSEDHPGVLDPSNFENSGCAPAAQYHSPFLPQHLPVRSISLSVP